MRRFSKPNVGAAAHGLEARYYLSEEIFQSENRSVFGRSWIVAGRSEEIAREGDFFVREIGGNSLIVTRDGRGAPHAFYNVCRHRGSELCTGSAGTFPGSIACPYHAWTYGLDGRLVTARNAESTPGFDRTRYPLTEAKIGTFEGFLFVNLDSSASPLASEFATLHERLGPWNLAALRSAKRIAYEVRANWKLVFQNYSECYHCPVIHPQLERLSASDSGRNDLMEGPFLGGYSTFRAPDGSLTNSGVRTHEALAGLASDDRERVYYYTIFPSLLVSLHPDYVMVHAVRPRASERTDVVCEWFFDPAMLAENRLDPSDAIAFWDTTNRQDWHAVEALQRGIASAGYMPGPYLQQEGLLAAFDRYYLSRLHLTPKGSLHGN